LCNSEAAIHTFLWNYDETGMIHSHT
jgi:hypothetical protein